MLLFFCSYVQTGCTSLKVILKRFWPLISDTLSAPPSVGVDITREERLVPIIRSLKFHLFSQWFFSVLLGKYLFLMVFFFFQASEM